MIVTLEPGLETLVRRQIEHGSYQTANEVVEAALRQLDKRERRLAYLRKIVAEAEEQFERGEYVEWTPAVHDQLMREARELARQGHTPHPDVVP